MGSRISNAFAGPQRALAMALAILALAFGFRLWIVGALGASIPFWDQWDAIARDVIKPFQEGSLTFSSLFVLHNEHRIAATKAWSLLLFVLNERQWDPLVEMFANAVLAAITAALCFSVLSRGLDRRGGLLMFAVTGLLWALPFDWENILAGFQSQFYLLVLMVLVAAAGISSRLWSAPWWLGLSAGVLAVFTMGAGALFLPAAATAWLLAARQMGRSAVFAGVVLMLVGVLVLVMAAPAQGEGLELELWRKLITGFGKLAAWPLVWFPWFCALAYAPTAISAYQLVTGRLQPTLVIAPLSIAGWALAVAMVLAISRNPGSGDPSSRHMIVLAIGSLANLVLLQHLAGRPAPKRVAIAAWAALILGGAGFLSLESWPQAVGRHHAYERQIHNTYSYLATGNLTHLQGKARLDIPYPVSRVLERLLTDEAIRSALPAILRVPQGLPPTQGAVGEFQSPGYYPATRTPNGFWSMGSWRQGSGSNAGDRFVGHWISAPVEPPETAHLAIPVAGYLGRPGLGLELVDAISKEILEEVRLAAPPRERWELAIVDAPEQAYRLQAVDRSTSSWLAFGAPRPIGPLSARVLSLLEWGARAAFAGLCFFSFVLISSCLARQDLGGGSANRELGNSGNPAAAESSAADLRRTG